MTIEEMAKKLALHFQPERIMLFGSQARGEAKASSDVDFLVIAHTDLPRPQRSAPMYSLLRDYPFSKDIIVLTPQELEKHQDLPWSLAARALREGRILYEKQS